MRLAATGALLILSACAGGERVRASTAVLYHLRSGETAEWTEYESGRPHGKELVLRFSGLVNETEHSILLWQDNVKHAWTVELNGRKLGQLHVQEVPTTCALAVPPGTLKEGENVLAIRPPSAKEDITVGLIRHLPKSLAATLSEARLDVVVTDSHLGALPCRITIEDATEGTLAPIRAHPDPRLAVRPGVVYTPDGKASITLPAGRYKVSAGRGFEYSLASKLVTLPLENPEPLRLEIRREVPTGMLAACDTHVHTLQLSGHGDSSLEERMVTLAGEGVELPVATEHNQHASYRDAAAKTGMARHFTAIDGNEVTTSKGHFNVFPITPGAAVPDAKVTDWPKLMESIRAAGAQVIVLNHPRSSHNNFVPFAPENFNGVTGENRRGFEFSFDAVELVNSGALRSDYMQVYRDWFALLNYGYRITGVGASDSHDVNRYMVGQGRTYVACRDGDAARIDVAEAVKGLREGRALVSMGLLTQIKVDGRFGVGDLATGLRDEVQVDVSVWGPGWTKAEQLELYSNGAKIREARVEGRSAGEKARALWKIPRPAQDTHLVAIATGPGVRDVAWPIPYPYQPSTPRWSPLVIGSTNPVWLDADGDGTFTAPRAWAKRLVERHGTDPAKLLPALAPFDEAVAAQAASLLHAAGVNVRALPLDGLPQAAGQGISAFAGSLIN